MLRIKACLGFFELKINSLWLLSLSKYGSGDKTAREFTGVIDRVDLKSGSYFDRLSNHNVLDFTKKKSQICSYLFL
jgi:hypothetical protein